jgi:multiphosphoryl transfer protein
MPEIRLTVIDESGLHARPAARFVQAASRFASRIVIRNGEREADAKSLISLLSLAVRLSNVITVTAEGSDADAALASLATELSPYVSPMTGNNTAS